MDSPLQAGLAEQGGFAKVGGRRFRRQQTAPPKSIVPCVIRVVLRRHVLTPIIGHDHLYGTALVYENSSRLLVLKLNSAEKIGISAFDPMLPSCRKTPRVGLGHDRIFMGDFN